VNLQPPFNTISECISYYARLHLPISQHHGLHVHLQTHSIAA
jgi:hypothetical protein